MQSWKHPAQGRSDRVRPQVNQGAEEHKRFSRFLTEVVIHEISRGDRATGMVPGQSCQGRSPLHPGCLIAALPEPKEVPSRTAADIKNPAAWLKSVGQRLKNAGRIEAGSGLKIDLGLTLIKIGHGSNI